mmetsp:Transcript_30725/g.70832  ORF Transcript_30725/g.70832 Transcript_30725/m.70832 type:complete len:175 (+) Transcript_30725:48-572(+)|eukprot:CAMPEP_0114548566 /NCGR_PEP_ID=MMETSP0114-20121206/5052_1 /TAXON_ID=31324 /ORGANISM="Goniomonas sp, Strain m" /LENGTH=174 /DNA_ID=CAMNT_0001733169 /DNA_START=21 /DNA_END=545 /DNA_ORIENTATION=+
MKLGMLACCTVILLALIVGGIVATFVGVDKWVSHRDKDDWVQSSGKLTEAQDPISQRNGLWSLSGKISFLPADASADAPSKDDIVVEVLRVDQPSDVKAQWKVGTTFDIWYEPKDVNDIMFYAPSGEAEVGYNMVLGGLAGIGVALVLGVILLSHSIYSSARSSKLHSYTRDPL